MKKLKMDLESLQVESFGTSPEYQGTGTVEGYFTDGIPRCDLDPAPGPPFDRTRFITCGGCPPPQPTEGLTCYGCPFTTTCPVPSRVVCPVDTIVNCTTETK